MSESFDIVILDPPWSHYGDPNKPAAAGKHYACIPDEDMLQLDVASYMHPKRSLAFVWATCPRLDFAIAALQSWELHYRGVAFAWVKTRRDGTPVGAQGVRASITKPTLELVLVGSPMARGRPLPIADESVAQVINDTRGCDEVTPLTPDVVLAARGEHSVKPDEVYARVARMYPTASKCELFARAERPGWTCVGDELQVPSRVRMRGTV